MSFSSGDTVVAVIGAVMVLALNFYAFRGDAAAAGHGRQQMLKMAAIWVTIIVGATLLFGLVAG